MAENKNSISFDDTQTAFALKSNKELKASYRLFLLMQQAWLVNLGTKIIPFIVKHLPLVKAPIRKTIFKQFVGGESLQQTSEIAEKLARRNVQVILDYGAEAKETEASFNHTCQQFLKAIEFASVQSNIPFISVKITGLARFTLLMKLDALMKNSTAASLLEKYHVSVQQLSTTEQAEWKKVTKRIQTICEAGSKKNVGVLVDAEESWIQDPIDAMTLLLMKNFNGSKAVVYNTFQLYRHDRLAFLKCMKTVAAQQNFLLGVKLVRGAYMEKERQRAAEQNYLSPIQVDKHSTDADFNTAVQFSLVNLSHLSVIIATHNEYSNAWAVHCLQQQNIPLHHSRVHFSQLYGMGDHITFNLAKAGCNVSKYLPYGSIEEVIPYLMRRAQENTSVKGQANRELELIKSEMKRRKI